MAPKRSKNQIRRERAKLRKTNEGKPSAADKEEDKKVGLNASVPEDSGVLPRSDVAEPEGPQNTVKEAEIEDETIRNETGDTEIPPLRDTKLEELRSTEKSTTSKDIQAKILKAKFASVFLRFEPKEEEDTQNGVSRVLAAQNLSANAPSGADSSSDLESDSESEEKPISKRQLRIRNKIPIADLKALTSRPQAVEWFDVDAPDPFLVVHLKTMPNAIDIPAHWQQKKEYLLSKRGLERPPFKLPKYIEDTGISEMRNHDEESLKKLQRDRVQPKMGKLDIDYQKLHDAFFKHQKKPKLYAFGELYYEGREKNDANRDMIKHMRPGKISRALRAAVGLPEAQNSPPPWVVLMNELGKPPAYVDCVIPGVDVEYSNLGYLTRRDAEWSPIEPNGAFWGHLDEGEELEGEEEELEEEEEEDGGVVAEENGENEEITEAPEDEPEKVDITEYSRLKTSSGVSEKASSTSGELYTVLKEKVVDGKSVLVEGKQGYEIGEKKEKEKSKEEEQKKQEAKPSDASNFKF